MAAAIITILLNVPNPGFSLSGIQRSRTIALIIKVSKPISELKVFANPCAKTDHGALPKFDWISSESPMPKIKSPKNKIEARETEISQRFSARHGVIGIVLCGRKNSINRVVNDICRE